MLLGRHFLWKKHNVKVIIVIRIWKLIVFVLGKEFAMNFILTKFVYPLKEKLKIGEHYYFDNPRTAEEIKYVAKLVREATPFPPNDKLAGGEGFITIDYILDKMKERYSDDEFATERINNSKYKDPCYKIASMWVVLRIKEKTTVDDYFECAKNVHSYIDVLTLLAFKEHHYIDFSVLISGCEYIALYKEQIISQIQNSIIEILVEATENRKKNIEKKNYRFNGFTYFYNEIAKKSEMIDAVPNKEFINYIMESIQALRKNSDLKMKFVSVVSIIELLLTHSPDYARFNVEESISKQFKNKIALICYLNDKACDYDLITKECTLIYSLRSDIAHGNFSIFPKDLQKYFRFCKENKFISINEFDKVYVLDKLITRTLKYMVIILNTYMKDYKLYEVVKRI